MSDTAPKPHGLEPVSCWVTQWAHLVPQGGQVLDVACGYGRHIRYFLEKNMAVAGVDIAKSAIEFIAYSLTNNLTSAQQNKAELIVADIENGTWPLVGRQFSAIVVTNYLWRPLFPTLVASLAPGGVLIYETFATGNETVGKPSRPDFLLQKGELLQVCAGLRIVAFEDGFIANPDRFVQRIVAVNDAVNDVNAPQRYALASS